MSAVPQAVRAYLEANRQRHLEALKALLRIPSIANVNDGACERAAQWCRDHLAAIGFAAEVVQAGGKPNVIAERIVDPTRPTVLVYGHYDVQPPDPLGPWRSDPFEPTVRDGRLYARGANDDKGQLMAQLCALEAWIAAAGELPCNVKVFVEGEEEIGSPHIEPFLAAHAHRLSADTVVISDSEFFAPGVPSITYALRGLAYFEITLHGPAADIHSGIHGGAVRNPVNALARLVAGMHDDTGRVMIPGFYDDVVPLMDEERDAWETLPFDEAAYAWSLGVEGLSGGEAGYSPLERRWARPTLDCNGIVGGYIEAGSKTIIPASAHVKVSCRLVARQDPRRIIDGVRAYVAANVPPGIRHEIAVHAEARPVLVPRQAPSVQAGVAALREAFGGEPVLIRCGASVPITEQFQRLLQVDPVLMGFGLPDDNLHSPNEKFDLGQFYNGAVAAAAFLPHFAEIHANRRG